MRKIIPLVVCLFSVLLIAGCKKDNYPGGVVSAYISIFDIRNIYEGTDVVLTKENMLGAENITGIVTSNPAGNNLPSGIITMQDNRRLNQLRGIAVQLASAANNFIPGDSLIINVNGATLTKEGGILQISGVTTNKITKVSAANNIDIKEIKANELLAKPENFESTLIRITQVGFDASYLPGTTYLGDKIINDGFGNFLLHTEATASFANRTIPFLINLTGIVFNLSSDSLPQLWPRTEADIVIAAATAPKLAPLVITGYLVDPSGGDGNNEYIQLMATEDIDFAVKNFSLVTTNNAGAAAPTGFPVEGWATGGARTYKFNITAGSVARGQYIYVGGTNKRIWGAASTDISSAFWVSKDYSTLPGDGFGTATNNLLANSGNAAGIAVFDLTAVTADIIPVDVIFFGGGGNMYTAGPPERGYKITNTDYYNANNPSDPSIAQPYFNMGSNTGKLGFPSATFFTKLGGVYNTTSKRWTTARTLNGIPLTNTSTLAEIEGATTLDQ